MPGRNNAITRVLQLAALMAPLLLAACGPTEFDPVTTIRAEGYQLQLLAPQGTLQPGANRVTVRVVRDGQPVAAEEGSLTLAMPPMGAMPAMRTGTSLTRRGDVLEGTISFEMGGE